jgi:hypothetical protein
LAALLLLPAFAQAARVQGQITDAGGAALANTTVSTSDGKQLGKTDASGVYSFEVPPGSYTFVISGQQIPVAVSPQGSRQDIRLKAK